MKECSKGIDRNFEATVFEFAAYDVGETGAEANEALIGRYKGLALDLNRSAKGVDGHILLGVFRIFRPEFYRRTKVGLRVGKNGSGLEFRPIPCLIARKDLTAAVR